MRGFTLIEMIISIVLLAIIGISLGTVTQQGMEIYVDTDRRENLVQQGKFLTERLHKELRDAVPNSVQVNTLSHCIEWLPIRNTGVYENLDVVRHSTTNKPVFRLLPEHGLNKGDRITIMPSAASQLYTATPTSGAGRTVEVANTIAALPYIEPDPSNPNKDRSTMIDVELTHFTQFSAQSPAHRFYAYRTPIAYCLEGSQVYRYQDYPLTRSDLEPAALFTGNNRQLMTESVSEFIPTIAPSSLQRNGLVKLSIIFSEDNETMRFDHDVLIYNTP